MRNNALRPARRGWVRRGPTSARAAVALDIRDFLRRPEGGRPAQGRPRVNLPRVRLRPPRRHPIATARRSSESFNRSIPSADPGRDSRGKSAHRSWAEDDFEEASDGSQFSVVCAASDGSSRYFGRRVRLVDGGRSEDGAAELHQPEGVRGLLRRSACSPSGTQKLTAVS